jgi:hypothetical protein
MRRRHFLEVTVSAALLPARVGGKPLHTFPDHAPQKGLMARIIGSR